VRTAAGGGTITIPDLPAEVARTLQDTLTRRMA
jgi:membrane protein YdbS with pleckstrin-like domain